MEIKRRRGRQVVNTPEQVPNHFLVHPVQSRSLESRAHRVHDGPVQVLAPGPLLAEKLKPASFEAGHAPRRAGNGGLKGHGAVMAPGGHHESRGGDDIDFGEEHVHGEGFQAVFRAGLSDEAFVQGAAPTSATRSSRFHGGRSRSYGR
jgi:hypothetical protein